MNLAERVNFITNNEDTNVYLTLKKLFLSCKSFMISVAFINYSGLQLLVDTLSELEEKGIKGKILTSDYLAFTDPTSLRKLHQFKNIETKMFSVDANKHGFHSKGYIFEYEDCYKVLIGSSNITQSALKSNVEWNLEVISKEDSYFIQAMLKEFNALMEKSIVVTDEFIERYNEFFEKIKNYHLDEQVFFESEKGPEPNIFQENALIKLDNLRKKGENKALIIAATGVGKTYASAFDVKNFNPKRMLYIVHNENILNDALKSFKNVLPDRNMGLFVGGKREINAEFVFSSIQTLHLDHNLNLFSKDEFDYIIVDEAHKSFAPTYQKVLEYFKPKFLLAMTATPDRTDGGNIYKLYDYNIAIDVRLDDALEFNLLSPFHYFGINDTSVDFSDLKDLDNIKEISRRLSIQERVSFIINKMEHYGFDGKKRKCLGFCADKNHAKFMADAFNLAGYPSVCLTGEDDAKYRQECMEKLQSDNDELECIFTVNIFNEGVDIPYVNLILMLRPTESPIIFTQQLGRGLRKVNGKEFLTVLDFISNYNRSFLVAIALSGNKNYDKLSIETKVRKKFKDTPGCTNIELDPVTQEQIINQLKNTNFNAIKYLSLSYISYRNSLSPEKQKKKYLELMDFFGNPYAPDPVAFVQYKNNYFYFLNSTLKDTKYSFTSDEEHLIAYFSRMLPLRRINEYLAVQMLLEKGSLKLTDFHKALNNYVNNSSLDSARHTFEYLSDKYFDKVEIKNHGGYFVLSNDELKVTKKFVDLLNNPLILSHLNDLLAYGKIRYIEEFGNDNYGNPFLKLYEEYNMRDLAILTNYRKCHSSVRGSGVWKDSNENYYYFVEINKDSDISDDINYDDYFKNLNTFNWQSPNTTTLRSQTGKDFINGNKPIHLLVRKERKLDGKPMKFIYVGTMTPTGVHSGEKPITIEYRLDNDLPRPIFDELQKRVRIK